MHRTLILFFLLIPMISWANTTVNPFSNHNHKTMGLRNSERIWHLSQQIQETRDNNSWVNDTKQVYYYNSVHPNAVDSLLTFNYDQSNSSWTLSSSAVFTYNATHEHVIAVVLYFIVPSVMRFPFLMEHLAYNNNGYLSNFSLMINNIQTGNWSESARMCLMYSNNNFFSSVNWNAGDDTTFPYYEKRTFDLDIQGRIILETNQTSPDSLYWANDEQVTRTYHPNDTMTGAIFNNNLAHEYALSVITGNSISFGMVNSEIYRKWSGSNWVDDSNTHYTYDGSNKLIGYEYHYWDGSTFDNGTKNIYTYDIYGNLYQDLSQEMVSGSWTDSERKTDIWGSTTANDMLAFSIAGNHIPVVGAAAPYTIVVKNLGDTPESGYSVKLMKAGNIEIASVPGTILAAGAEQSFILNWIPADTGPTFVYGIVVLAGDSNPLNNETSHFNVNVIAAGTNAVTIGNDVSSLNTIPIAMNWKNNISETIYLASEINAIGQLTGLSWYNNFVTTTLLNKPTNIWVGTTTQTNLTSGWIPSTALTSVFNGIVNYPSGQNIITVQFTTPFIYTGGNLVIMVSRPLDSNSYNVADNFFVSVGGAGRSREYHNNIINADPSAPPTGNIITQFPNVSLYFISGGGYITGTVTSNSLPIPDAAVNLGAGLQETNTDNFGVFHMNNVPAGTYSLTVEKHGYVNYTQQVDVIDGSLITLNISLTQMLQVSVSGRVASSLTPTEGIQGAVLHLTGYESYSTNTVANGDFNINNVYANRTYDYTITASGFQPVTGSITTLETNLNMGTLTLVPNVPPAANFTSNVSTGLAPLSVTFNDLSIPGTCPITSWEWNFGDNTPISTEQNPTHIYSRGIYTVSLTVRDSSTASNTMTLQDMISATNQAPLLIQPFPDLTENEDFTPLVINLSSHFADYDGDILIYTVDNNNNQITASITNNLLTITPFLNYYGTTSVTVTADDLYLQAQMARKSSVKTRATCNDTFIITINGVNDPPVINSFNPPQVTLTVDINDSQVFSVAASDIDSAISYRWYINGVNQNVGLNTFEHLFTASNTYEVKAEITDNLTTLTQIWTVTVPTDNDDQFIIPLVTALHPNYPNPFNPETTFKYSLKNSGHVNIAIFNIKGQLMKEMKNEYNQAGIYSLTWNGTDSTNNASPSGIYLIRMIFDNKIMTRKIMLVK